MAQQHRHAGGYYSPGEERAHALTHGLGCVAAVVGLGVLVAQAAARGDLWDLVGAAVYGVTLVLLYLASTLYHAVSAPRAKDVLQRIDHAAIYLLIAGTYTPLCLGPLRGPWGWSLLGIVWGLAILGAVTDVATARRFRWLSLTLYLLMGWLALTALRPLLAALDPTTLLWIGVGGIFYTGGIAFYLWRRLPWHHVIWHVCVLLGSASHWLAIRRVLAI
jgi:hemolysin III